MPRSAKRENGPRLAIEPLRAPLRGQQLQIARLRVHWNSHIVFPGKLNRLRITSVGVTDDSHPRITGEDTFETSPGIFGSISHHDHAGML